METLVDPWFVLCPQKILHVTCKLVSCMVKWVKPSKFMLRPSTYSFLPLYCRMIVCAIMRWLTETTTFYNLTNPLLIYTWVLNNQYGKIKSISDWIFTAYVACTNPVCRTWFFQLEFSKSKYRSTGGKETREMVKALELLVNVHNSNDFQP